ncbi:hypothetical protein LCGC14_1905790, partial [marine sediment metagenome]
MAVGEEVVLRLGSGSPGETVIQTGGRSAFRDFLSGALGGAPASTFDPSDVLPGPLDVAREAILPSRPSEAGDLEMFPRTQRFLAGVRPSDLVSSRGSFLAAADFGDIVQRGGDIGSQLAFGTPGESDAIRFARDLMRDLGAPLRRPPTPEDLVRGGGRTAEGRAIPVSVPSLRAFETAELPAALARETGRFAAGLADPRVAATIPVIQAGVGRLAATRLGQLRVGLPKGIQVRATPIDTLVRQARTGVRSFEEISEALGKSKKALQF